MRVGRLFPVVQHLSDRPGDIRVGNVAVSVKRDLVPGRLSLGEHVAVEVDLFQIGEHRLTVLQNRQGRADLGDIVGGVGIVEDQVGKVEKGVVVDLPREVLAGQGGMDEALGDLLTAL